jgi:hypothetical protein
LIFLDLFYVGDGIIKGLSIMEMYENYLFCELACFGGVIENFVVEDGKVESESESNGVGGLEFCVGNLRGRLVGSECSISSFFVLVSGSVL